MRCLVLSLLAATSIASFAQTATGLSPKWEELTGPDFITAIHQAQDVCILPFGIIEKHGPHLPLGTDLINVRYATEHAAAAEYAVIFPAYYFGQIAEARHEPGTVSYSMHMQLDLLQETTDEMGRNGCKKIIIVNGHGGNEDLLPYFAQSQLATPRDYVVYVLPIVDPPATDNPPKRHRRSSRRGIGNSKNADRPSRSRPHGPCPRRVRGRPGPPQTAGRALHRN